MLPGRGLPGSVARRGSTRLRLHKGCAVVRGRGGRSGHRRACPAGAIPPRHDRASSLWPGPRVVADARRVRGGRRAITAPTHTGAGMGTLRVLIIIDSFSFGGAEKLLAVLSRAAPSAGLDLEVASLAPFSLDRTGMLPVLQEAGLPFSFLDIPRLAYPAAVPRIARAVKESGCDIVHAHLGYSAVLAPVAARVAGRRCVATLHHMPEDLPLRERLKERMAVASSGMLGTLVFVSDASRREFARRYRERPETWQVAYNGVDLTSFSPGGDSF